MIKSNKSKIIGGNFKIEQDILINQAKILINSNSESQSEYETAFEDSNDSTYEKKDNEYKTN